MSPDTRDACLCWVARQDPKSKMKDTERCPRTRRVFMGLRRSKRIFGALAIAGLIGSASFAMTASNTFASTSNKSGQGAQTISGFEVSNPSYTLDSLDPEVYSAVEFDLDGAASDVRAKVVSTATAYSTCSNTAGQHWSCSITDRVDAADELTVIAVQ